MVFTPPPDPGKNSNSQTGKSGAGLGGADASVWMPKWSSDVFVNTATPQGIMGASDPTSATYNQDIPKSWAESTWDTFDAPGQGYMTPEMHNYIEAVAKSIDYRKTGSGLWGDAVSASAVLWQTRKERKTPFQIINEWAAMGSGPNSKGGGGSGSGRKAPQPADETTIRRAMDAVSNGLIGRTLSDKEFSQYYNHYTSSFHGNNDMDPQQDMIQSVRKDDNYEEYQVATKFAGALQNVIKGAA